MMIAACRSEVCVDLGTSSGRYSSSLSDSEAVSTSSSDDSTIDAVGGIGPRVVGRTADNWV